MTKLASTLIVLAVMPAEAAAQRPNTACTAAQAVPLRRPATQGDLATAGIDIDIRAVTLFVEFKPSYGVSSKIGNRAEARNCQLSFPNGSGQDSASAIYLTPDRYIHIRHGVRVDTIESWGFNTPPVAVRFGRISGISYREGKNHAGLLSFVVMANNKSSYFVQYRLL